MILRTFNLPESVKCLNCLNITLRWARWAEWLHLDKFICFIFFSLAYKVIPAANGRIECTQSIAYEVKRKANQRKRKKWRVWMYTVYSVMNQMDSQLILFGVFLKQKSSLTVSWINSCHLHYDHRQSHSSTCNEGKTTRQLWSCARLSFVESALSAPSFSLSPFLLAHW